MPGFLLIDKPAGITSHGVVARVRRLTGVKRVGHAGTLDPFATGLLIVGVEREATKRLGWFLGKEKTYEATARLGATTDTQDLTGEIAETPNSPIPTREEALAALDKFRGPIDQIPPMYSAKKIAGKKLYELARAGETIEREPRRITIHDIELLDYEFPTLKFRVRASAGTYVRTIAADLGAALGTGAYLTELRRTASGDLSIEEARRLDDLTPENWTQHLLPPDIAPLPEKSEDEKS